MWLSESLHIHHCCWDVAFGAPNKQESMTCKYWGTNMKGLKLKPKRKWKKAGNSQKLSFSTFCTCRRTHVSAIPTAHPNLTSKSRKRFSLTRKCEGKGFPLLSQPHFLYSHWAADLYNITTVCVGFSWGCRRVALLFLMDRIWVFFYQWIIPLPYSGQRLEDSLGMWKKFNIPFPSHYPNPQYLLYAVFWL